MKNVPIAKIRIPMKTLVFALFLLAALAFWSSVAIAFFALHPSTSFGVHVAPSGTLVSRSGESITQQIPAIPAKTVGGDISVGQPMVPMVPSK